MIDTRDTAPTPHADPAQLSQHYDDLRQQLVALNAAPVRDLAAIDLVIHLLDQTHAAFKAAHGVAVHQQPTRY